VEGGADIDPHAATVRHLAGQTVLDAPAEAGVTVNGEKLDGRATLAPGDRLRLGTADREILVVSMAE